MLKRKISIPFISVTLLAITVFCVGLYINSYDLTSLIYLPLGILGAIFANGTGAGGGAVFVPVFNGFGLSNAQIIATSFTIQCFGMLAGSFAWLKHYRQACLISDAWLPLKKIVITCSLCSITTIGSIYYFGFYQDSNADLYFSIFSILMGLLILVTSFKQGQAGESRNTLGCIDSFAICAIGFTGGAITSYISIGVGEMLAVYLILRGFSISLSIASAVMVTAATVWTASYYHWVIEPAYLLNVVTIAIPGALLGGYIASHIVGMLSPRYVKRLFAIWIIISGFTTFSL